MKPAGSPGSVLAAIREDAGAELERVEQECEAEMARLSAAEEPEVEVPDREERLAAASREARELLAREDYADARAALEAREEWMRKAARAGEALLLAPRPLEERRALLLQLAREALQRLPGNGYVLHLAPRDEGLLDDAMLAELGVTRGAPVDISGGCILRAVRGKVSLDNSFEERARRFEAVLRAALGKVYGS